VDEITAAGGTAVANFNSVLDGDKVIETAIKAYGRVDVLVNNAGILRDKSFRRMSDEDWKLIHDVHLTGIYKCTKAAWPYMVAQKSGRVICTSSTAGVYGNFGQANYAAAKLGTIGFTHALSKEGARYNINVNSICPTAGTRLTATVMEQSMLDVLKPEYVAPLVLYLASDECKTNGGVFEAGMGLIAEFRWLKTAGGYFDATKGFTAEDVRDGWAPIENFNSGTIPAYTANDNMGSIAKNPKSKLNLGARKTFGAAGQDANAGDSKPKL